jgi:hypothetical protein
MYNKELEKGSILQVSDILQITKDYTVMYYGIPVGSVKNNLSWFSANPNKPAYNEIKQVVYLGNYEWGVKQLVLPIGEFRSFDSSLQEEIICDLLEFQKTVLQSRSSFNY